MNAFCQSGMHQDGHLFDGQISADHPVPAMVFIPPDELLVHLFNRAGYRCGLAGKLHLASARMESGSATMMVMTIFHGLIIPYRLGGKCLPNG